MGLDITAYRKVSFVRALRRGEESDEEWPRLIYLYPNPHYPERADGLVEGLYVASGDFNRALAAAYKDETPDPDRMHFRAGSYGGYNEWRERLCILAHGVLPGRIWREPEPFIGALFFELIKFGDNEGIIGPRTSTKLAQDFASWQTTADEAEEWFRKLYARWRRAFEMAAGDGVVHFG
jgi:hypothetical protein